MSKWLEIADPELTVDHIRELLEPLPSSQDFWIVSACADRLVDNIDVQKGLLNLSLQRSNPTIKRVQLAVAGKADAPLSSNNVADYQIILADYFTAHPTDKEMCYLRAKVLKKRDRLLTYQEMAHVQSLNDKIDEEPDAWADDDEDQWDDESSQKTHLAKLAVNLIDFIQDDLLQSAYTLALARQFQALSALTTRHAPCIREQRFQLLETIPETVDPADYHSLLPTLDSSTFAEAPATYLPWRDGQEWVESFFEQNLTAVSSPDCPTSSSQLTSWYIDRALQIDTLCGVSAHAISLLQHGISQGIPNLEDTAEELQFLVRIAYHFTRLNSGRQWTLREFRQLSPDSIVSCCLSLSNSESVVDDIRTLIVPYILRFKVGREHRDASYLPTSGFQFLKKFLLGAPLEIVLNVCDASNPILPTSKRIISNDLDLVRLALSCLYASDSVTSWPIMSKIFESLPAWDDDNETPDDESLKASLTPLLTTFASSATSNPSDLFSVFEAASKPTLSRLLDILDVHLESGEILSRWGIKLPLRWFWQNSISSDKQRSYAIRVARIGREESTNLNNATNEWVALLDDMLKLCKDGPTLSDKGTFWSLSSDEMQQILFEGLLSNSNFRLARSLLERGTITIPAAVVETLCLSASREFFDNSTSGNLHQGGLKLAYDCLSVPDPSATVLKERAFIEATSRIWSFKLKGRDGSVMLPLQIRLIKDKLEIISAVLSSTADAYKYPDMILEMAAKLGQGDDSSAQIKVLGMLAIEATKKDDFPAGAAAAERMVSLLMATAQRAGDNTQSSNREVADVCWKTCYAIGVNNSYEDHKKRLTLLAQALTLCTSKDIMQILQAWTALDAATERISHQAAFSHTVPAHNQSPNLLVKHLSGIRSGLTTAPALPKLSASIATETLNRVTSNFPFSSKRAATSTDPLDRTKSGTQEGQFHARQAVAKGISWLMGDDESTS